MWRSPAVPPVPLAHDARGLQARRGGTISVDATALRPEGAAAGGRASADDDLAVALEGCRGGLPGHGYRVPMTTERAIQRAARVVARDPKLGEARAQHPRRPDDDDLAVPAHEHRLGALASGLVRHRLATMSERAVEGAVWVQANEGDVAVRSRAAARLPGDEDLAVAPQGGGLGAAVATEWHPRRPLATEGQVGRAITAESAQPRRGAARDTGALEDDDLPVRLEEDIGGLRAALDDDPPAGPERGIERTVRPVSGERHARPGAPGDDDPSVGLERQGICPVPAAKVGRDEAGTPKRAVERAVGPVADEGEVGTGGTGDHRPVIG